VEPGLRPGFQAANLNHPFINARPPGGRFAFLILGAHPMSFVAPIPAFTTAPLPKRRLFI
jgi:hypothetical protein